MGYSLKETEKAIKYIGLETEAELVNILVRNCIREGAKLVDNITYKEASKMEGFIRTDIDGQPYWAVVTEEGIATNILLFDEVYSYYQKEMEKGIALDDVEPLDTESLYENEDEEDEFRF